MLFTSTWALRKKRVFWAILLLFNTGYIVSGQVSRLEMESIRKRAVLDDTLKQKIRTFVTEQYDKILQVGDESELSTPVRDLLSVLHSQAPAAATQKAYSDAVAQAARQGLQKVYQQTASLPNKSLAEHIRMSAVVVAASIDNIVLINDLVTLLQDPIVGVRYWAAKGLAMPIIQQYLASRNSGAGNAVQNVLGGLNSALQKETSPVVIGQIANAAPVHVNAVNILKTCAAKRIPLYIKWIVTGEINDLYILRRIFLIIQSGVLNNDQAAASSLMRSATELFSVAFQRYYFSVTHKMGGKAGGRAQLLLLLPDMELHDLETLLIESEIAFIAITKSNLRPRIQEGIPRHNATALQAGYNSLIRPNGIIDRVFKIYPANTKKPDLPQVPKPPKEIIERAKILQHLQKPV